MPRAVLALAHFCEVHGPQAILTTQAVSLAPLGPEPCSDPVSPGPSDTGGGHGGGGSGMAGGAALSHQLQALSRSVARTAPTPHDGGHAAVEPPGSIQPTPPHVTAGSAAPCGGCGWWLSGSGLASIDQDTRTAFISSKCPTRPELFSLVRQACVRALSCEVLPGRECPMLFGNAGQGFALSLGFFLPDHAARGGQR